MINEVFGLIATVFPGAVFIGIVVGLTLLARTWSRMSSGSVGAGPALTPTPHQHGLQRLPWDIRGVSEALADQSPEPLTLLLTRAHNLGVSVVVPDTPSVEVRVEAVLDQLDAALGLPPLTSTHDPISRDRSKEGTP